MQSPATHFINPQHACAVRVAVAVVVVCVCVCVFVCARACVCLCVRPQAILDVHTIKSKTRDTIVLSVEVGAIT